MARRKSLDPSGSSGTPKNSLQSEYLHTTDCVSITVIMIKLVLHTENICLSVVHSYGSYFYTMLYIEV